MFRRFVTRSQQLERLDTGDYTAEEFAKWQSEMKLINRLLGDSRALRLALKNELNSGNDSRISILDVGAGSGELLKVAKETLAHKNSFLVGAELNADAAKSINLRSVDLSIHAVQCDALTLPFAENSFDYVISSLFLHHLDNQQAVTLVNEMNRVARKQFLIIDLHRHAVAYHLYRIFGRMFLQRFTLDDGSLSILRSFRPEELKQLAKKAGIRDAVVKRRAAFRLVLSGSKNGERD